MRGLHCTAPLDGGGATKAVVVFDGAEKDGMMSNESFALDVTTWKWTKLDCAGGDDGIPSPRAGACLSPLDKILVLLFGGATPGNGKLLSLNDVWALHVDMERGEGKWQCLASHRGGVDETEDDSMCPPGRNAHTLSPIDPENLLPKELIGLSSQDLDDEKSAYFLLQGGLYPFWESYNDVFLLRVTSAN